MLALTHHESTIFSYQTAASIVGTLLLKFRDMPAKLAPGYSRLAGHGDVSVYIDAKLCLVRLSRCLTADYPVNLYV